ncbi:MAG: hypothetical protein C0432_05515 [Candidatus Puniceispirillum sp.]|nr:hypothetical protein [Candidatus Pelagibacter sp.]MBA4283732.1 hypothetical protein [Candidatus Puniceispirillum sp.]
MVGSILHYVNCIIFCNLFLNNSCEAQNPASPIQNYEAVYSIELDNDQSKDISIENIKGFCKLLCKKNNDQWDLRREYHFVIQRSQDLPFSQHDLYFSSQENDDGLTYSYLKRTEENSQIIDSMKGTPIELKESNNTSTLFDKNSFEQKNRKILVEYDEKREIITLPKQALLPVQTIKKILSCIKQKKNQMTDLIFDGDEDAPEVMEADFKFKKQNYTVNPYIDIKSNNITHTQDFANVLKKSVVWNVRVDYYSLPRSKQIEVAYSYDFDINEEGVIMGAKLNFCNPDFTIKLVPKSFYIITN